MIDSRKGQDQVEMNSRNFELAFVVVLVIGAVFAIAFIEMYSVMPSPGRIVQFFLLNTLSAILGSIAAYFVLRGSDEGKQKRLIVESLQSQFDLIERHLLTTRSAVLDNANWAQSIMCIKDIPYEKLFVGAKRLGLMVQGWDKWPEDRANDLRKFVSQGGVITVILHDPRSSELLNIMRSRWQVQDKDCVAEIRNTEVNFKEAVTAQHHAKLTFIYRPAVIWYCLIRFEYNDPSDTVYIISPYAHRDYSVNQIPAVLLRKPYFSALGDFFDYEWEHLSQKTRNGI